MKNSAALLPLAFCLLASAVVAQGPLTPPAFPAPDPALNNLGQPIPSMKTLTQIEPRTPINATQTPGDADSLFRITQPGSYYLSGNVTGVSGRHGIEIAASDVTIDLMGFSLNGGGGTLAGIAVTGAFHNLAVRNGSVRNWAQGGVSAANASSSEFAALRISGNTGSGLAVGNFSLVSDCMARSNTGSGIVASGSGATISRCTATLNGASGIAAGIGGMVTGCTAHSNTGAGLSATSHGVFNDCTARANGAAGIALGTGSIAKNCVSDANTGSASGISGGAGCVVSGCTASNNPDDGIHLDAGGSVQGCAARGNTDEGIFVSGTVTNSSADTNGGFGIEGSAVHNCTAISNGAGIFALTVTNSSASSNAGTGIAAQSGVVAFCKAIGNGTDFDTPGSTRTGNHPAP